MLFSPVDVVVVNNPMSVGAAEIFKVFLVFFMNVISSKQLMQMQIHDCQPSILFHNASELFWHSC